jgi:hypothetical protein
MPTRPTLSDRIPDHDNIGDSLFLNQACVRTAIDAELPPVVAGDWLTTRRAWRFGHGVDGIVFAMKRPPKGRQGTSKSYRESYGEPAASHFLSR